MAVSRDLCEARYIDAERVEAVLCSLVDRAAAEDVANVFRVLADPTRVAILHALSLAELCNCDLAAVLRISESAVSHQMRELRLMKLVSAEKRGRMVYYRLSDTHIRHIFEDTLRHVREGTNAI
ncbi:MAG: ArsR/SmtB family transcription factor [Dehalococcoidia bacterium]